MIYNSYNTEETEDIAFKIAQSLRGGEIITLDGDLGAGKTAFVRGIAKGLMLGDIISSPTFTIVNEYRKGKIPLFHFDVYRLESSDELFDIGWEDYISQGAVVVVEWASIMPEMFADDCIKVVIRKDLSISEDFRQISIEGVNVQ